jgi:hypothetical protein
MQEVVELRLTITKLEVASIYKETMGLTFVRRVLFHVNETIPTDHLLVSDEAVRVMDISV